MIVHRAWPAVVGLDVVAWAAWGFASGWFVHRMAPARLDHDSALTRARSWEGNGRLYRRALRVRSWQRRLPEGGGAMFGGVDKRRVGGASTDALERYVIETRRAEYVHWLGVGVAPAFGLWNPPGLWMSMVLYAAVANVPCIVSLRTNRFRLVAVLSGRRRRGRA